MVVSTRGRRERVAAPAQPRGRRLDWSAAVPWVVLVLGILVYVLMYRVYRVDTPAHSDGEGYYAYLPAYIGHFDPSFNTVVVTHLRPAYPQYNLSTNAFGLTLLPNGSWVNKYGVGEAMLLVPFFVIGHVVALGLGLHADGYSTPEVFVSGAGAVVYTVLGLLVLRALLRRWFGAGVTAFTLVAVTFGTGVVSYFSFDALFSHDFSFFAVALTLLTAQRWFEQPRSWWRAIAVGLCVGLLLALRIPNAVLLVSVPLVGLWTWHAVAQRLAEVRVLVTRGAAVIAGAVVAFAPQVAVWYVATGHLVTALYPGETFDFVHPHLVEALVWLQPHGLLPYAPVMVLALAGMLAGVVQRLPWAIGVTVAFLLFWWVVSAWHDWSFSSSFGDRAYIDALPVMALPMAHLLTVVRHRAAQLAVGFAGTALVVVSCMLMVAWWQGRMAGDGIDAAGYARILSHPRQLLQAPVHPPKRTTTAGV